MSYSPSPTPPMVPGIKIALRTLDLYLPGPSHKEAENCGLPEKQAQSAHWTGNGPHFKIMSLCKVKTSGAVVEICPFRQSSDVP